MPKIGVRIHVDEIPTPPEGFTVSDTKFADGPAKAMTVTVTGECTEEEKFGRMKELTDWAQQFQE